MALYQFEYRYFATGEEDFKVDALYYWFKNDVDYNEFLRENEDTFDIKDVIELLKSIYSDIKYFHKVGLIDIVDVEFRKDSKCLEKSRVIANIMHGGKFIIFIKKYEGD